MFGGTPDIVAVAVAEKETSDPRVTLDGNWMLPLTLAEKPLVQLPLKLTLTVADEDCPEAVATQLVLESKVLTMESV
jgi:hypothetical protein